MAAGGRLHITNGDATGEMLTEIFPADEVLCWRDVLHDGPLTLTPVETHARRRARFLAETLAALGDTTLGQNPYPQILTDFRKRDKIMADLGAYAAVVLWFEHDLYDQLQLAEILYRLSETANRPKEIALICLGSHPEVPFFHGLGDLTPSQLWALLPLRRPVDDAQQAAGRQIWTTLCAPTPIALQASLSAEINGLPFMRPALRRWCQEYPARSHGLTLTQHHLIRAIGTPLTELPVLRHHLEIQSLAGRLPAGETGESRYQQIMAGAMRFGRIFHSLQTLEAAPFMGDIWVLKELVTLSQASTPYLDAASNPGDPTHGPKTRYSLTAAGRQALAGHLHWVAVNATDIWRGGVHLSPAQMWYWEETEASFSRFP